MKKQYLSLIRSLNPGDDGVLLRGALGAFLVNVLGLGLAFLSHVFVARLAPVEEYGIYSYVFAWVEILLLFATAGFDYLLLREVSVYQGAGDWGSLRGVLRFSNIVVAVSAVFLAGVTVGVNTALIEDTGSALWWTFLAGAVALPVLALTSIRQAVLRALKYAALARFPEQIVRPAIFTALIVGYWQIAGEPSAPWIMLLFVGASVVAYCIGNFLLQRRIPAEVLEHQAKYARREWVFAAFALLFVSGTHVILNQVDRVMLGSFGTMSDVAIYSVAARIAALVLFGLHSVNAIAAPLLADSHATSTKEELQSLLKRVAILISAISFPIVLVLGLFAVPFLSLFGEFYTAGYSVLLILLVGQTVSFLLGPVGYLLIMTGNERTQFGILLSSLILNIALNIPLIIFFGYVGAAVATSVVVMVRNYLAWRYSKKHLGVDASVFSLLSRSTHRE